NLAYTLLISDINNDGAADLLVGAPGADGTGDERVNAGEVYVLNGTFISIGDISLAGPGVKDDIVNPGGGVIYLNFTFRHSIDPRSADNSYVVLEPGTLDGKIGLVEGSMFCEARSITLDTTNSSVSYAGNVGRVSLLIEPGWNLRIDRPYDIEIVVGEDPEELVRRYIPDRFRVVNNVKLDVEAVIKVDGEVLGNRDPWLRSSSTISFEGLGMVYERPGIHPAPYDIVSLELYRNDQLIDERPLMSPSTKLEDTIPVTGSVTYSIKPVLALEPPPWQGLPYPVGVAGELFYEFKIDNERPEPIYGLYLEPDEGRRSVFDDDMNCFVGWTPEAGAELDNGSTVRYFNVTVEGQEPVPSMEASGLLGSYFNGAAQNELMFTRFDGPIDFNVEEWGTFGPDANYLDYFSFSIRWDGWFRVPSSKMYQFSVTGTEHGHAMLILDGVTMIPWSELTSPGNSVQRFFNEGDLLPIQVYYFFDTTDLVNARSAFSLRYLNDKGMMIPIPSEELLHSSNRDQIRVGPQDMFVVSVSAVDWVGHSSEPVFITGYLDARDPVFNLSGIDPWYGSSSPVLELGIRDPTSGGVPCSGIDQSSIEYRLRERSEDLFGGWSGEGMAVTYFEEGLEANISIRLEQMLTLDPSWRGSIQWRVADMVGNQVESSIIDIGIDGKGPEFELLSPNIQIVQEEGPNRIMMRVIDRPGSGVDQDSVQYRLDTGDGWTNWSATEVEGSGTEIIFDFTIDLPAGTNYLQFSASDLVGNSGESTIYTIITESIVINRPPIPGIRSPKNNTIIRLGNPITLDASDTIDDNNGPLSELRYTWISNIDGYLGSGRVIDVKLDSLGEHRIHLYVDDGEFNVSLSVYVTLETNQPIDDDDDDDLFRPEPDYFTPLMISLILLVILVVGILLVYRRYRNRKEEETRLEFVERTEDDIEYEIRSEEEERSMGIDVEKDETTEDEYEEERKKLYG
ncbi:MAG: FG-GAP repeat protein, partial [Candidatus Thermoplasmatota archaeon]|nr:FG-GAP repeat protein [Candidatus Thermoplasmatota archaeon]